MNYFRKKKQNNKENRIHHMYSIFKYRFVKVLFLFIYKLSHGVNYISNWIKHLKVIALFSLIIFHYIDIPHFYLLFNLLMNILLFFHILATLSIHVQVFVWTYIFNSLGYIPRSGIAKSHCNPMFNILRDCQTVSQSDGIVFTFLSLWILSKMTLPKSRSWSFILQDFITVYSYI